MSRKIGVSISLTSEQAQWLDEQDKSNSQIVRNLIDETREVEA